MVRMLSYLIGQDAFMKGIDIYLKRHDGEAATVEDYIRAMEEASGSDLRQFMLWYTETGSPRIEIKTKYDKNLATFSIEVRQHLSGKYVQKMSPRHFPLAIALFDPAGKMINVESKKSPGS